MRPAAYSQLRAHPLDGSLLLFRPSTGESLRIESRATRRLRAQAPRAVFVGLSNACNLRCEFCSRDASIRERWAANDMVALLSALAEAGTLEVAFGGGEPLAYAGFPELLARLAEETPLALHLTTNGTLIDDTTVRALAPHVTEARVSVYAETDWATAMRRLVDAGVRTSANLLVQGQMLAGLPSILDELAEVGVADVALLRRVGGAQLWGEEWLTLERCVRASPVPVKLSRCFADRMPTLPRLSTSSDCGAGREYLVIDPDARIRPCSFHDAGSSFSSPEELLATYRALPTAWRDPSTRSGCARAVPFQITSPPAGRTATVRAYQGYASNNSGDTVLVARFVEAKEAAEIVDALRGVDPEVHQHALRSFLLAEGCDLSGTHWDAELASVGRMLLATGYDPSDALGAVREVATRRGAEVLHSAVHSHDPPTLLIATQARGPVDAETELWVAGADDVQRHGGSVFATFASREFGPRSWSQQLEEPRAKLGDAPFAAELVVNLARERLVDGCKTLVDPSAVGWFHAWFEVEEHAATFSRSLDGDFARAGSVVLVRVPRFRKRLAVRAHDAGAVGCWLPDAPVRISASLYRRSDVLLPDQLEAALRSTGLDLSTVTFSAEHRLAVASLVSSDPLPTLRAMDQAIDTLKAMSFIEVFPETPLAHAMRRMKRDLTVLP
ncbi:MAG: radical SAM protein [Sandaracinaceae bacterium]